MNWSLQQSAVYAWFSNPTSNNLVIRSRAGTGKTTTGVEALRHIMPTEDGMPRVLYCAYNKRIADTLKLKLTGTCAEAKTMHALGFTYLRGAWGGCTVDDVVEEERIARAAGDDSLPYDVRNGVKKLISLAKGVAPFGTMAQIADLAVAYGCEVDSEQFDVDWMAQVARTAMDAAKTPDPQTRITFDDMLFVPVANGYAMPMYDWVIVDEAQDMNVAQLMLAQQACQPDGHIVVIGDDRQSIYGFRGADSNAIDRLKHELEAEELQLTTTYRCPSSVVAVAAKLVPDFTAAPGSPAGVVDTCTHAELLELVEPGDVILSRTNAPLVPLCLRLVRQGTAAKIEGRDVGKMLADRVRKLKAESVDDFLARLNKWARKASGRAIAKGRCVEQKLQEIRDVEATLEALAEDASSVNDILSRCTQMFGDVAMEGAHGLVVLSTVHKAKGLEWPTVYLLEGTLYCGGRRTDSIEEKNIHYVAVTRAMKELVMVREHEDDGEPAAEGVAA